jgi:KipI family sensor histidine kinase inhibitor
MAGRPPVIRILPVGVEALLVEVGSAAEARQAYRALRAAVDSGSLPRPRDLVPAAQTVLVDGVADRDAVATAVRDFYDTVDDGSGAIVEVEVTYDGDDLGEVAKQWGCAESDVIARHCETAFEVAFTGFAPGFAYLEPDTSHWREVSRRASPRTKVPAGAVGLAGPYCGIYPRAMPGGWQLIGRCDIELFDPSRARPALLQPGDRVRFVERP